MLVVRPLHIEYEGYVLYEMYESESPKTIHYFGKNKQRNVMVRATELDFLKDHIDYNQKINISLS